MCRILSPLSPPSSSLSSHIILARSILCENFNELGIEFASGTSMKTVIFCAFYCDIRWERSHECRRGRLFQSLAGQDSYYFRWFSKTFWPNSGRSARKQVLAGRYLSYCLFSQYINETWVSQNFYNNTKLYCAFRNGLKWENIRLCWQYLMELWMHKTTQSRSNQLTGYIYKLITSIQAGGHSH